MYGRRVGIAHDEIGQRGVLYLLRQLRAEPLVLVEQRVAVPQVLELLRDDRLKGGSHHRAIASRVFGEATDEQIDLINAAIDLL